ncbi:MAG: peptidase U32 family protein [Promethearchaeota archaeon]
MDGAQLKKVELLAPAKNFKCLKAGAKYADSFYFGVHGLNMRARADNFHVRDLRRVVRFCHDRGERAYLATNILVYEQELGRLRETIEQAHAAGVDAVIVHDFAAIQFAKEVGIPFHVSTQCNVSNSVAAKFYEGLGASRIILARELDLKKIARVKSELTKAEVEVFVHGAMCTSISGRCYFSQNAAGSPRKSANRGNCSQPCRQRYWVRAEDGTEYIYDGQRFLNSRDLCTIAHVPELVRAGIDAFKIEGRMRNPHYVDTVARVYREAIEAHYAGTFTAKKAGRWVTDLKREYNRGFTTGFLFGRPDARAQQHNFPANLSHFRLIEIGRVEAYDPRTKLADVVLTNGKVGRGMDLVVEGRDGESETYLHHKVKHVRHDGREVDVTPRGTGARPVRAQVGVLGPVVGGGKDRLYVFTNKTYKNRLRAASRGRGAKGKGRGGRKGDFYRMPRD